MEWLNWYEWIGIYIRQTRYHDATVCVRVLYFKAPSFLRPAARTTSSTGFHGQSSRKISIATKHFGGLLECLRGSSLRSPATHVAEKYLQTWYLIYEDQSLLSTCFVVQGATFGGQLLVRELSQRWVWIVCHLQ